MVSVVITAETCLPTDLYTDYINKYSEYLSDLVVLAAQNITEV